MKEIDYIIVGDGFAAMFFAHQLIMNGKKFILFSARENSASTISAGIVNPVVLKKFTTFWLAEEQIANLSKIMLEIESYTGNNFLLEENIYRIFHDENEQKLWQKKAETDELRPFLDPLPKHLSGVCNNFGAGRVSHSARVNVTEFFAGLRKYLKEKNQLIEEKFDYDRLKGNVYADFHFKQIVFCEGMGVRENPYFKNIPLVPNKGHHLTVRLNKSLATLATVKKKHFLFAVNDGRYYYGGTYDPKPRLDEIDEDAVEQLHEGLSEFYKEGFQVEKVSYGFRPTVDDRRPIVGAHPKYSNYFVLNGLGARGVLNGSYFAKILFNSIENGTDLPKEVEVRRFRDLLLTNDNK